jgi:capsular polysaccharide biosynthesis protein
MNFHTFVRKVIRRVNLFAIPFYGAVAFNKKYRPAGTTTKSFLKSDDSVEYVEFREPYVSTLNLNEEFIAACSYYCKPEMSVEIPGDFIVTLRNGRVCSYNESNTAILTEKNLLVEELSFQWDGKKDMIAEASRNKVFKLKGFTKPRKFDGVVFSLLSGGSAKSYYYHWMIDSISRLGLLKQSGQFDKVDYFLVPNYGAKYQKETLALLGIPEHKIIDEEFIHHIQADYLIVTSYTQVRFHHPKWACDFLHDSFTVRKEGNKRDKLIYIPRGDAAINRSVLNEGELIALLKEYGFETRVLSEMTIPDQAEYFNSAKLILGAHGSGLTNIVFCEPRTIVVELFPDKYVRHVYYDISNKMGLDYHYLLCPSTGNPSDTIEGQNIDMYVDKDFVKAKVKALLDLVNEPG